MQMAKTVMALGRSPRRSVLIPATVRHDGAPEDVHIINLSTNGFYSSAVPNLRVGDEICISWAGGGRHEAKLVRKDSFGYGFVFEQSLPSMTIANARTRYNVVKLDQEPIPTVARAERPEPYVESWSPRARTLFITGAALLSWCSVFSLVSHASGF